MDALVGMVVGSREDRRVLDRGAEVLRELEVPHTVDVLAPGLHAAEIVAWAAEAEASGIEVLLVADAGGAPLAGMVAANTRLPVVGIPLRSAGLGGSDALQAMAQAATGAPVATVGVDDARNGALLACRILALSRPDLRQRIDKYLDEQAGRDRDHRSWPGDDDHGGSTFGFHPR